MKIRVNLLRAAFAGLLAVAAAEAAAQSGDRVAVPLSDPSRPATLTVSLHRGGLTVTAYDGNEIVIVAREGQADDGGDEDRLADTRGQQRGPQRGQPRQQPGAEPPDEPRTDGLHRIPTSSLGMTATEHDNQVSVEIDFSQRDVALEIQVPRRTSVHAATVNGGTLSITGVTGEHELENVNGSIVATDIAGALVASTTNGKVQASFTEVTPAKAMSFSSFNGSLDVTFPAKLAATLLINSGRGEVFTDFDVEVQPQAAVIERGGENGRNRVRVERETRALVGGGGPEIRFKTFNGSITIRKR